MFGAQFREIGQMGLKHEVPWSQQFLKNFVRIRMPSIDVYCFIVHPGVFHWENSLNWTNLRTGGWTSSFLQTEKNQLADCLGQKVFLFKLTYCVLSMLNWIKRKILCKYRCQEKLVTSVKFLTYYWLSVILLLRVKE